MDDFEKLRQAGLHGDDNAFIELLGTGHYTTENEIPIGPNGETPLHLACAEGHAALTKELLDGSERLLIDYSNAMRIHERTTGFTPFLTAAMTGHNKCFKLLLKKFCLKTNEFNASDILMLFTRKKYNRYYCLSSRMQAVQKFYYNTKAFF